MVCGTRTTILRLPVPSQLLPQLASSSHRRKYNASPTLTLSLKPTCSSGVSTAPSTAAVTSLGRQARPQPAIPLTRPRVGGGGGDGRTHTTVVRQPYGVVPPPSDDDETAPGDEALAYPSPSPSEPLDGGTPSLPAVPATSPPHSLYEDSGSACSPVAVWWRLLRWVREAGLAVSRFGNVGVSFHGGVTCCCCCRRLGARERDTR